ncbi:hypothetical protein NMNIID777_11170 [Neisseria meningitidis]|nr:hypothetical protein NMNIID777_11170 [Neisseria meningitidis]
MSDFAAAGRIGNPENVLFSLKQNGVLKQRGDTGLMIYPIREILHKLAADYGLGKGDLVFTGTPSGVGAIGAGDNLALELDGLVRASFTVGC